MFYKILHIGIKEDISALIPQDETIDEITSTFNNSKFADRIILTFTLQDSGIVDEDILMQAAENFYDYVKADSIYIQELTFKINQTGFYEVFEHILENLPLYLDEEDYGEIYASIHDTSIENKIRTGYRALLSPTGIATKKIFFKDPLNIALRAVSKLQTFQIDNNFIIHQSCIFTRDKKHLLVFIDPRYPANDIKNNEKLLSIIQFATNEIQQKLPDINIEYYGGTIVAIENSRQIKKDIILTVSLSLLFLFLLFGLFFRKFWLTVSLFVPVLIGASVSLFIVIFLVENISIISLSIGAILVCISIDYSLHFITHNRETGNVLHTLKNISTPIAISCITTSAAILCIYVLKSDALKQLSLFASIGILATAVSVLVFLPFLIRSRLVIEKNNTSLFLEKIAGLKLHEQKLFIVFLLLLTILFFFSSRNVKFNSDISSLNFQSESVSSAERNLKEISSQANSSIFVYARGNSIESAFQELHDNNEYLKSVINDELALSLVSPADLVLSKDEQKRKIDLWNTFWEEYSKKSLILSIDSISASYKFRTGAFNEFYEILTKEYQPIKISDYEPLISTVLSNFIHTINNEVYISAILKSGNKNELLDQFNEQKNFFIVDKQLLINKLLSILKSDFNKLSMLSVIIVFSIILIILGRIELASIAFIPVLLSWIWTLGLMSITGIEFNLFNIIISSFIFGLGLDYSIFIVSGLLHNYKHGGTSILPHKLSVLLSALTTIGGFGVLIFAQHPALKSIAIVSIFGIVSVFLLSYTIPPLLFNFLINNNHLKRTIPVTFKNFCISVFSLLFFMLASFLMTVQLPFLYILPCNKKYKKWFACYTICTLSKLIVKLNITIKRTYIDYSKLDFSKPSVLISNHQSHLDLVLILMLNPKIIVFTNKWVWNNFFYKYIIRFADYYPAFEGFDKGLDRIKDKVKDGYSILIFPEGMRTSNGSISRFHQGAFNLAYQLNIPVQPILIHGAYECLPKNEFFLKSGIITLKFYDKFYPVPTNTEHGISFRIQTKETLLFYRKEFQKLKFEAESPFFFKEKLISQYIYKGPVLEWYFRVKLRLEKYYTFFHTLIPPNVRIVDIGCGYGFLAYMLKLTSPERKIIGLDYDEDKIMVAKNVSIKAEGIDFVSMDVTENSIPPSDVYILNDVLHYMSESMQLDLLYKCTKHLPSNGLIIIRDANTDMKGRTFFTKLSEIQSTRIFRFNKTKQKLCYFSVRTLHKFAEENNLQMDVYDQSKLTSNLIYILKRSHI